MWYSTIYGKQNFTPFQFIGEDCQPTTCWHCKKIQARTDFTKWWKAMCWTHHASRFGAEWCWKGFVFFFFIHALCFIDSFLSLGILVCYIKSYYDMTWALNYILMCYNLGGGSMNHPSVNAGVVQCLMLLPCLHIVTICCLWGCSILPNLFDIWIRINKKLIYYFFSDPWVV